MSSNTKDPRITNPVKPVTYVVISSNRSSSNPWDVVGMGNEEEIKHVIHCHPGSRVFREVEVSVEIKLGA